MTGDRLRELADKAEARLTRFYDPGGSGAQAVATLDRNRVANARLLADAIDALETANYWDEISECVRCVSCDTKTEEHGEFCEIAPLLARFRALGDTISTEGET